MEIETLKWIEEKNQVNLRMDGAAESSSEPGSSTDCSYDKLEPFHHSGRPVMNGEADSSSEPGSSTDALTIEPFHHSDQNSSVAEQLLEAPDHV